MGMMQGRAATATARPAHLHREKLSIRLSVLEMAICTFARLAAHDSFQPSEGTDSCPHNIFCIRVLRSFVCFLGAYSLLTKYYNNILLDVFLAK